MMFISLTELIFQGRMILLFVVLLFTIMLAPCCNDSNEPQPEKPRFTVRFEHKVNGNPLELNRMIYTNAAGNPYEVSELMYFISDLTLYHSNGGVVQPATWDDIHYVDLAIPSTLSWVLPGKVPDGRYDSIRFVFGIAAEKNTSFRFVNPPEVNMAWPDILGGGYHYLMINGWWLDTLQIRRPFNFHLGRGQIYRNNSGLVEDIIGFIDNAFVIRPSGEGFTLIAGQQVEATLIMDIQSWFEGPHVYDHNLFGGAIMQNQEAMRIGCENGKDAFSVKFTIRPLQ